MNIPASAANDILVEGDTDYSPAPSARIKFDIPQAKTGPDANEEMKMYLSTPTPMFQRVALDGWHKDADCVENMQILMDHVEINSLMPVKTDL